MGCGVERLQVVYVSINETFVRADINATVESLKGLLTTLMEKAPTTIIYLTYTFLRSSLMEG
jgi:hypothetical protein